MSHQTRRDITNLALIFELGLGLIAILVGWLVGRWPLETVREATHQQNLNATLLGVAATLPMLVMLWVVSGVKVGPLVHLNKIVEKLVIPLFSRATTFELFAIAMAAGVGEELFFRGLVQSALVDRVGEPHGVLVGLLAASLLFGVCHWITTTYAVLATGIGIYLGWLFVMTDNLLAPIITHGLYDFVALLYLVRWKARTSAVSESAFDEDDWDDDEKKWLDDE